MEKFDEKLISVNSINLVPELRKLVLDMLSTHIANQSPDNNSSVSSSYTSPSAFPSLSDLANQAVFSRESHHDWFDFQNQMKVIQLIICLGY